MDVLGLVRGCIEPRRVVISIPQIFLDVVVVNGVASLADGFENFFINFRLPMSYMVSEAGRGA